MCPVLTPGLYLKAQQLATEKDELGRSTMKNIMRKYLSRWHPSIEHWTSKNVGKLNDGVEDKGVKTMITSPWGIRDLL